MFDPLISFFRKPIDWVTWFLKDVWRQVVDFITSAKAVVLFVISFAVWIFKYVSSIVGMAVDYVDSLTWPDEIQLQTLSGPARQMLEIANTFFPVNEFFTMLVAYFSLWIGLLVYRAIRRFIF